MDASDLHLKIDYVGSCGIVLTPEQKASLQTSLTILKHEQKFTSVKFWGIIKGIKGDYYMAQGTGKDVMSDKRTIYSKDCISWGILPIPSKADINRCLNFKARFTGDPSFEFEHTELKQIPGEGDELNEIEETITMKEEDRLAAVLSLIDQEAQIVPRGAYLRLASGQVIKNRSFEGLTVSESAKLSSYFHFRPPIQLPHKPLIDRARLDKAIDFLDTIEDDIPKGCWTIQFERGDSLVLIKNLLWLGHVMYQLPGNPMFGSIYVGTGEYNIDLPFML